MKPAQALVACSILGVVYVTACGSGDDRKSVPQGDAGAGGQGGEPPSPAAGEGGVGGVPIGQPGGAAGTAGEASQGGEGGGAGQAGAAGQGGEGGQPPECFEQVDENAAGAGAGAGAGGASFVPALHFSCEDLNGYYDVASRKLVLVSLPPGMELTVSGQFGARYDYTLDTVPFYDTCTEGSLANTGTALELSVDFVGEPTYLRIPTLSLQDACGATVEMDRGTQLDDFCWGIRAYPTENGVERWAIDCYEGYGSDCQLACPTIID